MQNEQELLTRIDRFLTEYFVNRKYFGLIYGSFANGTRSSESDIDLFIALESFTHNDLIQIKKFIINFHEKNNLKIDNEVPFENKLMVSYNDVGEATKLKGFVFQENKIVIPPVIKSRKFLDSKEVRLRLILNALTTPHIFLGNDYTQYMSYKNLAEESIFSLSTSSLHQSLFNVENIVEALLRSENGEEGEMFLGYKRHPFVIKYLNDIISRNLAKFEYKK